MRAVLLVNPKATTTSERARDVLVRALRSEVDLSVRYTRQRGHATTLAREAAEEGVDAVVTLGGDGTVNEVVNGLMTATTAGGAEPTADRLPALATVPGGSTNVFARALGLPREWPEGASMIMEGLRLGRRRTIGLGRADDRYFTFCAGFGLDASVIHRVEEARRRGRVSSPSLYFRAFSAQFLLGSERRHPAIQLERPGEATEGELATIIVQNTAPWTYVGDREVNPNPGASFDLGLDVLALRQLGVASTTRTVTQFFSPTPDPRGRQVLRLHDVAEFTLVASRPQAFQLDGDYLGEREKVRFTSVPAALRVIC
ncbi:diacylglycerol kinase family lipid kinase [Verrucosispora sp. WMMA2044]|uniref:Diacylglycerol kinase family lipid kinase n=1 Tax=Verrucosispora sioxanthis TaxID=2499994 RepID=A0A6M1L668_9ACTN|nr:MULTISPECIES: diacylglycerol kinase family protein [Micromonospora]NEE64684.1 diacylglycerol kinase family lipid kinase [Verrucosispora sioxanthis]NGM13794.1 diacylglycerol kinase family lipid kinase [Verrucosispora sioxanthis]WBB49293.1 diacylglycerol kinase family lipid kinase [Verrucosispora sp. WMMA2044]